ncbi:winged helix-turn-helix domain-containing protein [bacterium]|nr:winged helix-turn-helix domain-containing protein [bacterium]
MLEALFGSINCERVLMYLLCRNEGYATGIASFFNTSLSPIQKQLEKLELGGILVSKMAGRTRLYMFNPRYPLIKELCELLKKTLKYYPKKIKQDLTVYRSRPRRSGKPL